MARDLYHKLQCLCVPQISLFSLLLLLRIRHFMIKTICWSFSHTLIIYIYFALGKPALFFPFYILLFSLFCKMYNMQFQHSTYLDQSQYDLNSNNKAALPSPMTASSLDSPPNNKVHNQYNTMPLSSSPKSSYANRIQQQQQQLNPRHALLILTTLCICQIVTIIFITISILWVLR